jgi:hypothetical protein
MQTTEAPFVVSHNFCAVRGNSVNELLDNLREFNSTDEIEAEIQAFRSKVANAPFIATVQAPAPQAAVALVQQELGGTVVSPPAAPVQQMAGPEVMAGKYGDRWTYGLAEAPALPDGRGFYVLREWTDAKQTARKAFVDPAKGPKPFAPGAEEAKILWK